MLFVLLQTFVFWKICNRIFENAHIAFLSTLVFIPVFFGREIFGTGNFSEQYGALCTSSGLYFVLAYMQHKKIKSLYLSAFLFGLAPWFKEPFLLSFLPYVVYFIYLFFKNNITAKQLATMAIMACIPGLIMAGAISLWASWPGFMENLRYSTYYSTMRQESIWQRLWFNRNGFYFSIFESVFLSFLLCIPGIISLFTKHWKYGIGLLIAGQQICDWYATALPGNWFAHYYLQTAPLTILTLCMGFVWLGNKITIPSKFSFSALFLFGIFLFSQYSMKSYIGWRTNPEKRYFDAISRYLNAHEKTTPRHIVLASSDLGFYMPQAQGISHMRYAVPYPYHWIWLKDEPKNIRCTEDSILLVTNMAPYVIYNGECATFFQDGHMDSIILKNYHEVVRTQLTKDRAAILLKRNGPEN